MLRARCLAAIFICFGLCISPMLLADTPGTIPLGPSGGGTSQGSGGGYSGGGFPFGPVPAGPQGGGPSGFDGCFVRGTNVWMADGTAKPIDLVEVGDLVMCDHDPEVVDAPDVGFVKTTMALSAPFLVDFVFDTPTGELQVTCTPEHPFYVPGAGTYVRADKLSEGMCATTSDGDDVKLLSKRYRSGPVDVFNFHVRGASNYFIVNERGESPVLVHNKSPAPTFPVIPGFPGGGGGLGGSGDGSLGGGSGGGGSGGGIGGAGSGFGGIDLSEFGTCFVKGTLVLLSDGSSKPIERIEVGDLVACDIDPQEDNGSEIGLVEKSLVHSAPFLVDLVFESRDGSFLITTTPEHPFYVPDQRRFVVADDLVDRMCMATDSGEECVVSSKSYRMGPETVFNLHVRGAQTYFVMDPDSTTSILVHNKTPLAGQGDPGDWFGPAGPAGPGGDEFSGLNPPSPGGDGEGNGTGLCGTTLAGPISIVPTCFDCDPISSLFGPDPSIPPTVDMFGGCFVAGTRVLLADGSSLPIERIESGAMVLCDRNPADNDGPEISRVSAIMRHGADQLVELVFGTENGTFLVVATPEHPFYDAGLEKYVLADELVKGDTVRTSRGDSVELLSSTYRSGQVRVFNLEVEHAHSYYVHDPVSGIALLVHNKSLVTGTLTGFGPFGPGAPMGPGALGGGGGSGGPGGGVNCLLPGGQGPFGEDTGGNNPLGINPFGRSGPIVGPVTFGEGDKHVLYSEDAGGGLPPGNWQYPLVSPASGNGGGGSGGSGGSSGGGGGTCDSCCGTPSTTTTADMGGPGGPGVSSGSPSGWSAPQNPGPAAQPCNSIDGLDGVNLDDVVMIDPPFDGQNPPGGNQPPAPQGGGGSGDKPPTPGCREPGVTDGGNDPVKDHSGGFSGGPPSPCQFRQWAFDRQVEEFQNTSPESPNYNQRLNGLAASALSFKEKCGHFPSGFEASGLAGLRALAGMMGLGGIGGGPEIPQGEPSSLDNGQAIVDEVDLEYPHNGTAFAIKRTYRNHAGFDNSDAPMPFGENWHSNLGIFVDHDDTALTAVVDLGDFDGKYFIRSNTSQLTFSSLYDNGPLLLYQETVSDPDRTRYVLQNTVNKYRYVFPYYTSLSTNAMPLDFTSNRYGQGEDYEYDSNGYLTHIDIRNDTTILDTIHIDRESTSPYNINRIRDYGSRTLLYSYDSQDRLTHVEPESGSEGLSTTSYGYDVVGSVTHLSFTVDGNALTTGLHYDAGNIISITYPDSTTQSYAYDTNMRIVTDRDGSSYTAMLNADGLATSYIFENTGGDDITYHYLYEAGTSRLTTSITPTGISTNYEYDGSNRVTSVERTDGSLAVSRQYEYVSGERIVNKVIDELGNSTEYEYDSDDSVTLMRRHDDTTRSFAYNDRGLRTVTVDSNGISYTYTYDSFGFEDGRTLDKGVADLTIEFDYDLLGRLTAVETPEGRDYDATYDAGGQILRSDYKDGVTVDYAYDNGLRLTGRTVSQAGDANTFAWTYEYDSGDRVVTRTIPGGGEFVMTYDQTRLVTQTSPEGRREIYGYDGLGRQSTVKRIDSTTPVIMSRVTYDADGRRISRFDGNGHLTEFDYDGLGRMDTVTRCDGSEVTYTYDAASRILRRRESDGTTVLTHRVYGYDSNGRIITERMLATPTGTSESASDRLTERGYEAEGRLTSEYRWLDASAKGTTAFVYDDLGRLLTITRADGNGVFYLYDDDGLVTNINVANLSEKTYKYDVSRRVTTTITEEGIESTYAYNALGRPTQMILEQGLDGATASWVYDAAGNVATAVAANDTQTIYTYDDDNLLSTITSPRSRVYTYVYDDFGRPVTFKDEGVIVSRYVYDEADNVISTFDANNHMTELNYNCFNRPESILDGEDGSSVYTYELPNRLSTITAYSQSTSAKLAERKNTFNAFDQLTESRLLGATSADDFVYHYDYDRAGRMTSTTIDLASGGIETEYEFDRVDRVTQVVDPDGNTTEFAYDAAGRFIQLTDARGGDTDYFYDADNRLTARLTPEGISHEFTFDYANRPVTGLVGDGVKSHMTRWGYDLVGNLTSLIAPDNATWTLNYDLDRNLTLRTTPNALVSTYIYDTRSRLITLKDDGSIVREYSYDPASNLTLVKDGLGREAAYAYDAVNRATAVTDAVGDQSVVVYDALGRISRVDRVSSSVNIARSRVDYDEIGRVEQIRKYDDPDTVTGGDDDEVTEYTYDRAGRLVSKLVAFDASTFGTYTFGYNNRGLVTTQSNPECDCTERVFDATGKVVSLINTGIGSTMTYAYDADRRQTLAISPEGISTAYEYDARGLRLSRTISKSGEGSFLTQWTYDSAGNMVTMTEPDGTSKTIYGYDVDRRLTSTTSPGGRVVDFVYDLRGRLLTSRVEGVDIAVRTYDNANNVLDTTDANGNVTDFGYDPLNRITLIEDAEGHSTTYAYESRGMLVKRERIHSDTTVETDSRREYDAKGNLTEVRQLATPGTPGNSDALTNMIYDRAGRMVTSIAFTTTTDAQTGIYAYDGRGLVTDITGTGEHRSFDYDSGGRRISLTNANGHITEFDYDKDGRLTLTTTPEGIATEVEYDILSRRVTTTLSKDVLSFLQISKYDDRNNVTQTIAPDGLATDYDYDGDRQLVTQTSPSGVEATFEYDTRGRLTTGRAEGEIIREVVYDDVGNAITMTDARGNDTIYAYDTTNRRTRVTDATDAYDQFTLDARGNVIQSDRYSSDETPVLLTSTKRSYDKLDRLTVTRGLLTPGSEGTSDSLTTLEYDRLGQLTSRIVTTESGGASNETSFVYDLAGRVSLITDPDAFESEYRYDAAGNRTKVLDEADEATTFEFDKDRRQTKATLANGDYVTMSLDIRGLETDIQNYASGGGTPLTHARYSYDAAGRMTVTRRKFVPGGADNAADIVVEAEFDDGGRLTLTTSASGNDTTYAYDEFDRITLTTLPDGSYRISEYDLEDDVTKTIAYEIANGTTHALETRVTLDVLGRPTLQRNHGVDGTYGNADDITTAYTYDDVGRLTKTLDELGTESKTLFDALSRRSQTIEDVASIARDTYFEYDRAGRLLKVIAENDAGNGGNQTTEYEYNGRDLPVVVTYEVTGDVSTFYDERGSLTLRVDEAGTSLEYGYDTVNRLTERLKSGATTQIQQYVYDGAGRMITARTGTDADDDADSLSVLNYDALSLLQSETQKIGAGNAKTVTSSYDTAGRRDEVIYHDNLATVEYAYDSRDRCASIDLDGDRLADYTWFGRGLHSREVTCDYPGGTKPQFESVFLRDGVWRVSKANNTLLTEDQADAGYSNLGAWTYAYDKASNPLDSLHAGDAMGFNEQDHEFTYDDLYRLATAELTDTLVWEAEDPVTSTYEYDKLGNRLTHVYRGGSAIVYEHNKANQMTGLAGLTPAYDLAGNQTLAFSGDRGSSYIYKYDHNNRLTGVYDSTGTTLKATYDYDAIARRIVYVDAVNDETTQYFYDGANEIVETGGDGVAKQWYVHGKSYIDERLMMFSEELARPFYYAIDRMYNVRGLVDRAGALVETVFYDGFGTPLVRRSPGRGDMDNDADVDGTVSTGDHDRWLDADAGTIWDPRADLDDDGDVDTADKDLFLVKKNLWNSTAAPSVQRAFSHFNNPFLWQGRPQFVFDTAKADSDGSSDDQFGASVAISGNDMVAGAIDGEANAIKSGTAFVYRLVDGNWEIRQRLLASDAGSEDAFGTSVAIDGDTIVVGAPLEDEGGVSAGAAYVFKRINNEWTEVDKLYVSGAGIQFGTSVAIEGDVIAVGAQNGWDTGISKVVGKVFVYRWDGDSWEADATLDADTEMQQYAQFGVSVDVDGDVIVVGADKHDVSSDTDRGKFYIFRYDSGTTSWSEDDSFAPSSAASDRCGTCVAVSGDRVVAGAWGDDTNYTDGGAAYVVEYDSTASTWGSAVQITPSDTGANDYFGTSVDVIGDRIIVGAPAWDDGGTANVGAVYVYDYDSVNDDWDDETIEEADDAEAGDNFGRRVALTTDRFIGGAQYEDEFGSSAGAAYGFDLDGSWSQTAKITAELPSYAEEAVVVIICQRLRMYAPVTGKWLTRDPIGYLAGSWNIYEYVRNSPWRWLDPFGLRIVKDGQYLTYDDYGGWFSGTTFQWTLGKVDSAGFVIVSHPSYRYEFRVSEAKLREILDSDRYKSVGEVLRALAFATTRIGGESDLGIRLRGSSDAFTGADHDFKEYIESGLAKEFDEQWKDAARDAQCLGEYAILGLLGPAGPGGDLIETLEDIRRTVSQVKSDIDNGEDCGASISDAVVALGFAALGADFAAKKIRRRAKPDIGEYRHAGGHHPHQQAAFKGHAKYSGRRSISISQDFMRRMGWDHDKMTRAQERLQRELAASGRAHTMKEQTRIGIEALMAGGATRQQARAIMAESLGCLRKQGVTKPTHIPFSK